MSYLALLETQFPVLLFSVSLIFGLLIGSFLNVVIYRLPIMLEREWESQAKEILELSVDDNPPVFNLVFPNSHCPHCDAAIRPWENIPLISYLLLKGKCSSCQASISCRYPFVELITGLLTALIIMRFGPNLTGISCCIFSWALIASGLIDFDHKILPDDITLPVLWLGLIVNYFGVVTSFASAFWGAIFGYLTLWTVYQVFKLVTGKDGMGFGDFKLLALLGAWLGWQQLPLIIILSSLTGAIIGGALILLGRDRTNPIPFGPCLVAAGILAMLWGDQITQAYLEFMA